MTDKVTPEHLHDLEAADNPAADVARLILEIEGVSSEGEMPDGTERASAPAD